MNNVNIVRSRSDDQNYRHLLTSHFQSPPEYCSIGFYSDLEYWNTNENTDQSDSHFFLSPDQYNALRIEYSNIKFFSINYFQRHKNLMEKFPVDEFCL